MCNSAAKKQHAPQLASRYRMITGLRSPRFTPCLAPSSTLGSLVSRYSSLAIALLLIAANGSSPSFAAQNTNRPANTSTTIVHSTAENWRIAELQKFNGGLFLPLPSKPTDGTILAEVFHQIPNYFPEFKLNTISRGLHSSLLYLDDYSMSELRELVTFLKGLDASTLEAYDLLRPVKVFDPSHVEFSVVGTKSRFLAIKPSAEFVEWQLRFWKMLDERGPRWIMERQRMHRNMGDKAVSADAVHFSLIQWDSSFDPALIDEGRIRAQMTDIFEKAHRTFQARHGQRADGAVYFDWKESPIQIAQAAASFSAGPLTNFSIKANDHGPVSTSDVITLRINESPNLSADSTFEDPSTSKVIEALTENFINARPSVSFPTRNYPMGDMQKFAPLDDDTFTRRIQDRRVLKAYKDSVKNISPSWKPATVPAANAAYRDQFYVAAQTHPGLEPQKTFALLELARTIGIQSTNEYSVGMSIYASSARREIKNPSDIDLMLHTIAWVPDTAPNYDAAKNASVVILRKLVEQLRDLDRSGKIAITELRLGSDATMGRTTQGDHFEDALNNPYLSRTDIYRGYYVDPDGKKWSIEDLISTGDFFKLKLDLFTNGERQPVSLQIGAGFNWRGNFFHLNQNGAKGIQPALRTAIYDGPDSMAIALSLHRPYLYYAVQKYPILPRAIGDLRQTAKLDKSNELAWAPKFVKKFYGFLFLIRQNELGLESIFHQEVSAYFESIGAAVPSMNDVIHDILQSINRKELATLNETKHVANDLREFNEMKHRFTDEQWTTRMNELNGLMGKLNAVVQDHSRDLSPETRAQFEARFQAFKDMVIPLSRISPKKATVEILAKKNLKPLVEFEDILGQLEIEITGAGLQDSTKQFIEAYMRILPDAYEGYLDARALESPSRKALTGRLMNLPSDKSAAAPVKPPSKPSEKAPSVVIDICETAFL